jgi:hypothetical protein
MLYFFYTLYDVTVFRTPGSMSEAKGAFYFLLFLRSAEGSPPLAATAFFLCEAP